MIEKSQIWLNGEIKESGRDIAIDDRGFLLGDGVFETIRLENGKPVYWQAHLDRLRAGLACFSIDAGDLSLLRPGISALYHREKRHGAAAARITVTRGPGGRGVWPVGGEAPIPSVLIALSNAPAFNSLTPLNAVISERRRFTQASSNHFKAIGGYTENMLAKRDALAAGAGEALLLNDKNRIACATAANIFAMFGNELLTPSLSEGALPGVMRARILALGAREGLVVREGQLSVEATKKAFVFITNSLAGLRALSIAGVERISSPPAFDCLRGAIARDMMSEAGIAVREGLEK